MKDLVRQTWNAVSRRCDDERGVALIVAAGSMVALTSAVALAIDVGMLTVARTEAQSAADGAAMAGASALIESPDTPGYARAQAIRYAGHNTIRGDATSVLPEDVDVNMTDRTVTVRVYRTADRGNPMGTFFARIFGVNSVDISTLAKAKASNAGGVNCLLPLTIPDRWAEGGGPGNDPDSFDPDKGDTYVPWMDTSTDPPTYNDQSFTGYTDEDIGEQIAIKSNSGGGDYNPSWYYPWRPPGQSGADDYRENVRGCVDTEIAYYIGQEVSTEPGNMVGPTNQGFSDLEALDPNAVWNEQLDCVTDSEDALSTDGSACRSSPRIRPIPMFDPTKGPENGASGFEFTNFAGIFVEGKQGNEIVARWIGYRGVEPASPSAGTSAGPQFKVLQLIE
ncbi:MAG: pilus assembly protein TadG-related protein [Gemmatimonadota bacterium]